ncbi:MAG: class I SAM-dependent methyltransferase [Chloroflexi bacterium]|nr:class I SAM-dependent methyltransferase [Chloroflexota bacterium]MCL5273179.1 class I SAM-dependent methyltransferase [Chloroflexota bacterium]
MTNKSQTVHDSPAAYAALAHFYDLQHATYTPDAALYTHFAAQCQGDILEIGSGTGRVMTPLVESGYRVVGVDESPEMLQFARARLAHLPAERWRLIEADARGLDLPDRFGMALIALNTFLHNLTRDDQVAMLAAARRHLLPGGLLIVDLPPNDELAYQPDDGEYEFEATLVDPITNAVIDKFVSSEIFWAEQTQVLSYRLDEKTLAGAHSQTVSFRLRHVFRYEMELLLLNTGFRQWQWYGDYDLSAYTEDSPRMIAVATA